MAKQVSQTNLNFGISIETEPMEARSADQLPSGEGWQYEPKWDGFRCLAFKKGREVDLRAKSGKGLARYFPEIVAFLAALPADQFVIDGELVIAIDGELSFNALQMRLHPAESRIRTLSIKTPARLVAFDMLVDTNGMSLLAKSLGCRRARLEALAKTVADGEHLLLSPSTNDVAEARRWLSDAGGDTDGVICKRIEAPYLPGERAMTKVKRLRTADCVVGGFRYDSNGKLVGSLLLGLYNDNGELDHVGYTSTIRNDEKPELTAKLEALREAPGFTGKAPGGPSRWATKRTSQWQPLKPTMVVEVKFDQITGRRFRHGTKLLRWRPDKKPSQCDFRQIEPAAVISAQATMPAGVQTATKPSSRRAQRG
ncbi:ATP-dependent DNA ligase [Ensifer adhaerens]|uniref:ATP-dependent DNA ligase n=1 Tax=Ensifer canadensis TaxID=555315 RepID=UPI00148F6C10|nr:ATP-dependent DNA ligase [Ensifer canadensis]NOV21810.1 ATP-dependent DNA ligase [Ensifer canadensis]